MKIGAIIQARIGSTRLPGKVLIEIKGKPVLEHIIERLMLCKNINEIVVATTTDGRDDKIVELCKKNDVKFYRGSEDDVLERFFKANGIHKFDVIVRVTADDLFIDPTNIDEMINSHLETNSDLTYTDNMPLGCGLGMVVVSEDILKKSYELTEKGHPRYREHIDEFVLDHPEDFKINILKALENLNRPTYRLTLDTEEDLVLINKIFQELYKGRPIELSEIVKFLDDNKHLLKINSNVKQK